MERRTFIKQFITMSLAVPVVAACANNNSKKRDRDKIVIIGAGLAGISAAKLLQANNYDVLILESTNYIGGRTRTDHSLDIPFDTGASWIHGINGNPIKKLANNYDIQLSLTNDESLIAYIGSNVIPEDRYYKVEDDFYNILKTISSDSKSGEDFYSLISRKYPNKIKDPLFKFFLSTYLAFDTGPLNNLSGELYDEGEVFSGPEKMISGGYDQIAKKISKNFKIKLNQHVKSIDYQQDKIKVETDLTSYVCNKVVITVPLGVLKNNIISFSPNLPSYKRESIENVGMNYVNKYIAVWEKPFWDDKQYLVFARDIPDIFNYFVNLNKQYSKSNALMSFAYGAQAQRLESLSDNQVIEELMLPLKTAFGDEIKYPVKFNKTSWVNNKNSFGSYSYISKDSTLEDFDNLEKPIGNKIFFAGEHTDKKYFSTAHGAYLSGIKAAKRIINNY